MALNREMHPRNPYKDKPPDFKQLALEFADFRQHCLISSTGQVCLNFKEDAAVRALAKVLLKKDFNLEVDLPSGTLVPRIPQRMNYILMLEDLLKVNNISKDVIGIDIGTGASCVYALLGARTRGWKFVATDAEEDSVNSALRNVARNKLADKICVAHVDGDSKSVLLNVVSQSNFDGCSFSFCMCNPPFFESSETDKRFSLEPTLGQKVYTNKSATDERTAPHSATVASSSELQTKGGEVAFVNRIIDDSILLRDRICIYTSMLGRKQSVTPLRRRLERLVDVKMAVSTLNQGKTKRWILAWTFNPNVILQLSISRVALICPSPGLAWLGAAMKPLEALEFGGPSNSVVYECRKVTWTHQRAKRRLAQLSQPPRKRARWHSVDVGVQAELGVGDGKDSLSNSGNFVDCQLEPSTSGRTNALVQAYFPTADGAGRQFLRFRVCCSRASGGGCNDELNFELLAGPKFVLNQLIQHLRNLLNKSS